jgi:hypothetical protein
MREKKPPKDIGAQVDGGTVQPPRGFARLSEARRREIASLGGKASHASGTAHKFTPEEARQAGIKGGRSVSADIPHMMAIGRLGGISRSKQSGPEIEAPTATPTPTPTAPPTEQFLTVGEVIKYLRVRAGLSRRELASRTDLAQVTILSIEQGKKPPHRATIQKLQTAAAMAQLVALCDAAKLPLPPTK